MEFHAWCNLPTVHNLLSSKSSAFTHSYHQDARNGSWTRRYAIFDPGNKEVQEFVNQCDQDIVTRYEELMPFILTIISIL
jgi:uncharacterized lipoprotein YddW (UPF0748 family)